MTLYRQARALGYRLDLDLEKKKPLEKEDREQVDSQLVGAYNADRQLGRTRSSRIRTA